MSIPRPGRPVRGSRSGKAIMALFDLLGRRWALGIIWNLSEGPLPFRELQDRCETISPTVLSARLKELTATGILVNSGSGYGLTPQGAELFEYLRPIGPWAIAWARTFDDEGEGAAP